MGDFRIQVDAVGGHGCQREIKDGGTVYGCGSMSCPDCITAEFISRMIRSGANVKSAALVHWPGQASEVVDEFHVAASSTSSRATRTRHGSF